MQPLLYSENTNLEQTAVSISKGFTRIAVIQIEVNNLFFFRVR